MRGNETLTVFRTQAASTAEVVMRFARSIVFTRCSAYKWTNATYHTDTQDANASTTKAAVRPCAETGSIAARAFAEADAFPTVRQFAAGTTASAVETCSEGDAIATVRPLAKRDKAAVAKFRARAHCITADARFCAGAQYSTPTDRFCAGAHAI